MKNLLFLFVLSILCCSVAIIELKAEYTECDSIPDCPWLPQEGVNTFSFVYTGGGGCYNCTYVVEYKCRICPAEVNRSYCDLLITGIKTEGENCKCNPSFILDICSDTLIVRNVCGFPLLPGESYDYIYRRFFQGLCVRWEDGFNTRILRCQEHRDLCCEKIYVLNSSYNKTIIMSVETVPIEETCTEPSCTKICE